MSSASPTVEELKQCFFPDYGWLLEIGRQWVQTNEPERIKSAIQLFEYCRQEYPHAPQFGVELALALLEMEKDTEAEPILKEIEPLFGVPDEELLCRWGRIFKDRGDRHALSKQPALALASAFYRRSLEKYDAGFQLRHGHYPGINKATLQLILAGLESNALERQRLLAESATTAKELLARRKEWTRSSADDNIWHLATEAEAHCLEGHWDEAVHAYRCALNESNLKPFHRQSMAKQARRIVQAYRTIGIADVNRLDEIEKLFSDSPPLPGTETTPPAE